MKRYDYTIVGGGAAGFSAAIKLSELTEGKASIALVNYGKLGGTCVNVGCVPSKYLIEAAKLYHEGRESRFPGIGVSTRLDFKALMNDLRRFVAQLRSEKYEQVLQHYGNVEVFHGKASFTSSGALQIAADGQQLEVGAEKYLIATGSRPVPPPIEGINKAGYLDSDRIWSLEEQPESMLVIGAGAIGLEIGQAMLRLGTKIHLVEVMDRILPGAEPEISDTLYRVLKQEGMDIHLKTRIARIATDNGRKRVSILTHEGEKSIIVDEVLAAAGRRANTEYLNLDKVGVELDGRGFVKVDDGMRTSNPRIYAAGDVISKKLMLETLSAREGVVAAINMTGGHAAIDYSAVPVVTFTEPQAAFVGMSEQEVSEKYGACSCRVLKMEDVPKARITRNTEGLIKIVIHPYTGKIAGVHALSANAAEYIIAAAYMLKTGQRVEDVIDTIHVFPSFAEAMKLAATAFTRPVEFMPCCME
ncbi:MAG: mercury(II) reductase [Aigarchaeota archaeon]|nr:mercury(II) reductase [Candidatus Pelearchaeum maunauluense]